MIKRFSEDIDLNYGCDGKPVSRTQGKRLRGFIDKAAHAAELRISNSDDVLGKNDFNRYEIYYPKLQENKVLKDYLYLETSISIPSFPAKAMLLSSYIGDYLVSSGAEETAKRYGLSAFAINVQTLERTFIDKLFAVGDYYLNGKIDGHSRHIYDLHKILPRIVFNEEFTELFEEVRRLRSADNRCCSAQPGRNVPKLLREVLASEAYKKDYTNNLSALLYCDENVSYRQAAGSIEEIVSLDFWSDTYQD